MIDEVRCLAGEPRPVFARGCDHRLDGFLADLLGDLRDSLVEQPRRVRAGGLVPGALGDGAGQPGERAAGRLAEAGRRPGVARRTLLAHEVEHRVPIAVHAHLLHRLRMSRRRAFLPQLAARAAAVVGLTGVAGPLEGLAVGVGHHQHLAGERALSHDGDESIVPEAHGLNPIFWGEGHPLKIPALTRIVKIPAARISLRPMRWVASLFALVLMMALFHRITAGGPLEARATLALGFAAGPAWLGLMRADEVAALQFIADAAVGLLALAAGSELTLEMLRTGRTALGRLATGAITFPFVAVTLVAWSVSPWLPIAAHQPWPDRLTVALVLGTFAAAGAPAITVAMMGELEARGPFPRSLLGVTIAQDLGVAILFPLVLVVSKALASAGALNLTVAGRAALHLVGSLAVGFALALVLSRYLRLARRSAAVFLGSAALLAAETARLLQLETVLIALATGFYLENFARAESEQLRRELNRGAPAVYVIFFALGGAGLQLGVLAELWPWALLLIGLRLVSLRYGLLWAGRHPDVTPALARNGWLGLISQGGVALGLAQLARRAFPEWGVSLEALVVAMIGVHEVAGPICFRQALVRAGEVLGGTHGGEAAVAGRSVVAPGGLSAG